MLDGKLNSENRSSLQMSNLLIDSEDGENYLALRWTMPHKSYTTKWIIVDEYVHLFEYKNNVLTSL